MSDPADGLPYMAAWFEAQQAFARLAGTGFAANAAAAATPQSFADAYRQLFAMPGLPPLGAMPAAAGAASQRYQAALQRFGILLNEAAVDAGRRLGLALAAGGPDAPPIASLRELRALWIDCGEAAWSVAAHREEFAAALAELLAAWALLRAGAPPA